MKKLIAVAIVFAFMLVTGMALAVEGETAGKSDSAFECAAKCISSWGKCGEKGAVEKAPAPELTEEELQKQRENTGMGMRGRIK